MARITFDVKEKTKQEFLKKCGKKKQKQAFLEAFGLKDE